MKIYLVVISLWFVYLGVLMWNILGNIWVELCNIKEYAKDIAVRYAFKDEVENDKKEKS